jgi:uncharacterized protein with HEPN domain
MDAGNAYRHQYDNIERELVWDTVQQDLAALLTVAEIEIANLPNLSDRDSR